VKRLVRFIQPIIDFLRGKRRPEPTPEPEPEPTPIPTEPTSNRFLWKPESESRQNRAAVLLPARIEAAMITVNGELPAEDRGRTNGHRLTFFLRHTGAYYGSNVMVEARHGGAAIQTWIVPNGAQRYER
jgi:hypothetical protein